MPPYGFAEFAHVAFVPLLLWGAPCESWFRLALTGYTVGWAYWLLTLSWIRHMTLFGTVAFTAVLALFFAVWFLYARWHLVRIQSGTTVARLSGLLAIAGSWVLLECLRSWIFSGSPWAQLALSQWNRIWLLQLSAWTGAYGVSFVIVLGNLALTLAIHRKFKSPAIRLWRSPEMALVATALLICLSFGFATNSSLAGERTVVTATVVQPYIPAEEKWEASRQLENYIELEQLTRRLAAEPSDLVLWPESSTPWPVIGHADMRFRLEGFVQDLGKPILMGNLAYSEATGEWRNGICLITPSSGLVEPFYSKRKLVPFGEFVPTAFKGIFKTAIPLDYQFVPGEAPNILRASFGERSVNIGSLVCYEDIFPQLTLESARAGADVLFIATNNAWFGEGGGAFFHAAHSILRAVESRRPVMRCGNGGWSGWIDATGRIRQVILDTSGKIYFRGGGTMVVRQFETWQGRQSFYTRHGDWFVALAGAFTCFGLLSLNAQRKNR